MKILIVSEYFYPIGKGGGEISGFLFAKELLKNKIQTHVLTSNIEGVKEEEVVEGLKVHRLLKTGRNPNSIIDNIKRRWFFEKSLLSELEKLDKKENFDIIHCMNASSVSAIKLKDKLKKKFILHVNSPVLFCPKGTLMYKDKETCDRKCARNVFFGCYLRSSLIGKIEMNPFIKYNLAVFYSMRRAYEQNQMMIKGFDHFIAISKFMKSCLKRSGIKEDKISVIYPLIEAERFNKLKRPNNKIPKILYLGEYSKPKGPQLIIEALKVLDIPYEANFYGEGVLRAYLKKESKRYKLNVNIHKKAEYCDIPRIMEKHDIVIIPSLVSEGFGRVALEALVAGRYVIANNVGGLREIVSGRGVFVDVRDRKRLVYILKMFKKNRSALEKTKTNLNMTNMIKYLEFVKK